MNSGKRPLRNIFLAPFHRDHWRALFRSFRVYERPFQQLFRYVFSSGSYPHTIRLRTPIGPINVTLHTAHDLRTVNEIFCRNDYPAGPDERLIVDFGSNIGISALFFITRSPHAFCYLYEPLPQNLARLKENVAGFTDRVAINGIAVGVKDGTVNFGYEESGRYGGIGLPFKETMPVPCRKAVSVLEEILTKHEVIDILKIDIEALEKEIIASLPLDVLKRVRNIYVEQTYSVNPFSADLFRFQQGMSVARFSHPLRR
jgi:FkbM family methyltransferase